MSFPKPLTGKTVLDFSLLLPGPYCTSVLASYGARIIKIEPLGIGDPVRVLNPSLFKQLNRGKESIALDLKAPEAIEIIHALVKQADAVIDGFRPGVMDRLGIGYQALAALNPALVFCALSGFGQTGPYRDRAGHDINFLGLAGYFATPSQLNDVKSRPNVRLADLVAGQNAAMATSMAMVAADQSGQGSNVDVAIFDSLANWSLQLAIAAQEENATHIEDHKHIMGDSEIFETSDGRFLTIGTLEDKFWAGLVGVVAQVVPELGDERFTRRKGRNQHKRNVFDLLTQCFAQKTLAEWQVLLDQAETCWGPVYEGDEVMDDPHVRARGLVVPSESGNYAGFPVTFDGDRGDAAGEPVALGASAKAVLAGAGFSEDQTSQFLTSSALGAQ